VTGRHCRSLAVPTDAQRGRIDNQFLGDMNGICIAMYNRARRAECLLVARATTPWSGRSATFRGCRFWLI